MKTPDKIYISEYNTNVETGYFSRNKDNVFTQEYIRKDALMEWAKGEIMPGNSAEGKGWNWALQTLIEKIETL